MWPGYFQDAVHPIHILTIDATVAPLAKTNTHYNAASWVATGTNAGRRTTPTVSSSGASTT